jgi:hypothetical protein
MTLPTIVGDDRDWSSTELPSVMLDAMFGDDPFKTDVLKEWPALRKAADKPLASLVEDQFPGAGLGDSGIYQLFALTRVVILRSAGKWSAEDLARKGQALREFIGQYHQEANRYTARGKPNPHAVMWPDPTRAQNPRSIYEDLPYVQNLGLISKETPVGSAGSCFAVQIASNLQRRGYNYVVTEFCANPEKTVVYPDHREGDNSAMFCANWGILFNSPSFMQIAERAFGEKNFPRLLLRRRDYYIDPFREGVNFQSPEAYEENYEKHTAASREALLKAEVFVVTMGLNECWQYLPDGSFIHRNPNNPEFYAMVRHRTLTVEENVRYIQRFYDIVRAHNLKFKLIVTVSPIPFLATGLAHEKHVVVANSHSKATLRLAAEQLVQTNEDVHYLPSYEMITSCIRDAWEEDQRHVKQAAVDRVMQLFDAMFMAEGDMR